MTSGWQGLDYAPCYWLVEGSPLTEDIDRPISAYPTREAAERAMRPANPKLFVVAGTAPVVFYPSLAVSEEPTCQP